MRNPYDHSAALVVFAHIVRGGSLSAAAKQLGLGRAAVSKQLQALEQKIGSRLLQRSTRKLSLTEIGQEVLVEAQAIESALQSVESISSHYQNEPKGSLKVSCTSAIGRKHLLPLMGEFFRRYPKINVNLQLEDRVVDLITEKVDVSIRVGYLQDSSLIARQLGQLQWSLCASPQYLSKAGEPTTPKDLLQHNCIYYRNNHFSLNNWGFIGPEGEEYVQVEGSLAINDASTLVEAAIDGVGILYIDHAMHTQIEAGKLVHLLPNYKSVPGAPVYVVYPAREHLPAKTQTFIDFVFEKVSLNT